MIKLDDFNINSFLKFGFYLKSEVSSYDFPVGDIMLYDTASLNQTELTDLAYSKFKETMLRLYHENGGSQSLHLVPISGGFDSRMILAMLHEISGGHNIFTYTYGTPGTWNYDIGEMIAKEFNTNHRSFELTSSNYTIESLRTASRKLNHSVPLFFHPNFEELDIHFSEHVVWSGFLGCLWKGKSLPNRVSKSKDDAVKHFIKFNKINASSVSKYPDTFFSNFLMESLVDDSPLSYDDQLSFFQRQKKYVYNYVSFKGQKKVVYPLMEKEMLNFWLSINFSEMRQNGTLLNMLSGRYFSIFNKIPNTENYGASYDENIFSLIYKKYGSKVRNRLHRIFPKLTPKHTNYINFQAAFISDSDFRQTIKYILSRLQARDICNWIDIDILFNQALINPRKSIYELLLLASLELHIEAHEVKS